MGGGWRHPYRRSLGAILVVGIAVALTACSSSGGTKRALPTTTIAAAGSTTSATASATTTTRRPATSSTAPPTTRRSVITPAPDALGRFTDPADAANHLYNSWKAANRPEAETAASAGAVDSLFARPWQGPDYTLGGCTNREFGFDCRFAQGGSSLLMRVEGGASAGYHVETVTFS